MSLFRDDHRLKRFKFMLRLRNTQLSQWNLVYTVKTHLQDPDGTQGLERVSSTVHSPKLLYERQGPAREALILE